MSKRITVFLSYGPKREVQSPVLPKEEAAEQFQQIQEAQQGDGHELFTLPWLSVNSGLMIGAHVEDVPQVGTVSLR